MAERTYPVLVGSCGRFAKADHSVTYSQAKRNAPARPENPGAWADLSAGGRLEDHRSALN